MGLRSWIIWKGANIGYGLFSRILWPRASAVAFVVEGNQILAVDTGEYLMLPGGGLGYGETFDEAAERETLEETGYQVEVKQKLRERTNSVGGVEVIYDAELLDGEQHHEGTWEGKPVWIELDEIEDRNWRYNRDMKAVLDAKQS